MTKIMVIGGTPIDTKMGCELLQRNGYNELIPIFVSHTPREQTVFQVSGRQNRKKVLLKYLLEAKHKSCDLIVIYCNSLSSSVDFEKLSLEVGIKIITPFFVYRNIAKTFQKIGLLAANAQGLSGIEREMISVNQGLEIGAVANIDWVNDIEKGVAPSTLIAKNGLMETINLFEKMSVEVIVFGCTHFPYFFKEYQKKTTITCLNPDDTILKEISLFSK